MIPTHRMPSSSVGKVFGHRGYPDGSSSGGPGSNPGENENFWKNSKNYLRSDSSSIKGTLCSAKPGCRVAQLVKCLVTSGYADCSSSGGPERA